MSQKNEAEDYLEDYVISYGKSAFPYGFSVSLVNRLDKSVVWDSGDTLFLRLPRKIENQYGNKLDATASAEMSDSFGSKTITFIGITSDATGEWLVFDDRS